MTNELMLFPHNNYYIAGFTGTTGNGEYVVDEEAHNIYADNIEDAIFQALSVWGAHEEETNVTTC